jgi:hypothetical protein
MVGRQKHKRDVEHTTSSMAVEAIKHNSNGIEEECLYKTC